MSSCDCTTSSSDARASGSTCPTEVTPESSCESEPACNLLEVQVDQSLLDAVQSSTTTSSGSGTSTSSSTCGCGAEEVPSCDCTSEEASSLETGSGCRCLEPSDELERTLALVMPEAVVFRRRIERAIVEAGFRVCETRWLRLTAEQASHFYGDDFADESFERRVAYLSSGPILAYVIGRVDAVRQWQELMGPENIAEARLYAPDSIRGRLGLDAEDYLHFVYGSRDRRSAEREIRFFFPNHPPEHVPTDDFAEDYLWKHVNPMLSEALVQCFQEKPEDPITWLGNWLLDNNTPKYLLRYKSNLSD